MVFSDFFKFESQKLIELNTACGNTKKRSDRPTRSRTKLFVGLHFEKTRKIQQFLFKNSQNWPF